MADSIAVGVPRNPQKAMCQVRNSLGNMVTVSDDEILEAMRLLGRTCGVFAEPAAAASVAGLVRAVNQGLVGRESQVAVISTGNGLKDIANALKAAGEPLRVAPDIDQLAGIFEEG